VYFRSQPKEFHALCRSWMQLRIACKTFHHEEISPLIRHLTDLVDHSLQCVPHFLDQLNEDALHSGDKTQLFTRISDYPAMNILLERIKSIETELEVFLTKNNLSNKVSCLFLINQYFYFCSC
jgi:DNA mismatch repair protein MSH3